MCIRQNYRRITSLEMSRQCHSNLDIKMHIRDEYWHIKVWESGLHFAADRIKLVCSILIIHFQWRILGYCHLVCVCPCVFNTWTSVCTRHTINKKYEQWSNWHKLALPLEMTPNKWLNYSLDQWWAVLSTHRYMVVFIIDILVPKLRKGICRHIVGLKIRHVKDL